MNATPGTTIFNQANNSGQSACTFTLRNVHTDEALARFIGDEPRYRHWLLEFVESGPAATGQIRQAITSGSLETAAKLAHGLKGRTGMLGMAELHSIAQTLEMALRNNEPILMWLEELERTVGEMVGEISAILLIRHNEV